MTSKSSSTPWRRTKSTPSRAWSRSSTSRGEIAALENLRRSLKAATSSRNRLTRLAPAIFSVGDKDEYSNEEDRAWLSDYIELFYRLSDEKQGLPPQPASASTPPAQKNKGPAIPEDE